MEEETDYFPPCVETCVILEWVRFFVGIGIKNVRQTDFPKIASRFFSKVWVLIDTEHNTFDI